MILQQTTVTVHWRQVLLEGGEDKTKGLCFLKPGQMPAGFFLGYKCLTSHLLVQSRRVCQTCWEKISCFQNLRTLKWVCLCMQNMLICFP